jgi:hypothetical protein
VETRGRSTEVSGSQKGPAGVSPLEVLLKEHSPALGHNGTLFLDELTLYPRHALESLRRLWRTRGSHRPQRRKSVFPLPLLVVAAMNPCPCDYSSDAKRRCRCSDQQMQLYPDPFLGTAVGPFRPAGPQAPSTRGSATGGRPTRDISSSSKRYESRSMSLTKRDSMRNYLDSSS